MTNQDSEGRWACPCGTNMGGQYPHQYADGTQVVLCEDCIEAVDPERSDDGTNGPLLERPFARPVFRDRCG